MVIVANENAREVHQLAGSPNKYQLILSHLGIFWFFICSLRDFNIFIGLVDGGFIFVNQDLGIAHHFCSTPM